MKNRIQKIDVLKLWLSAFTLISMYIFSDLVRETVKYSIKLCAEVVIPSLLPYITATSILTKYLNSRSISIKNCEKGRKNIIIYVAIIISILSGFPSGALTVSRLYFDGIIPKRKAEVLIGCFCNISPAFCIYVFGGNILGSTRLGLICFFSVILSDFITYFIFRKKYTIKDSFKITAENLNKNSENKGKAITEIICSSMYTVIEICSFITIFMCIANVLKRLLLFFIGGENTILIFLISLLEITSGLEGISSLGYGRKFLLGNALLGFCGVSAISQVCNVCVEYELSTDILIKAKIISCILVPVISLIMLFLFPFGI